MRPGTYVETQRLPNKYWYYAVFFMALVATLMTFFYSKYSFFLYFWAVFLYGVGWSKQLKHRPDNQMAG